VARGGEVNYAVANGLAKLSPEGPVKVAHTNGAVIDVWPTQSGFLLALFQRFLYSTARGEVPPPKRTSNPSTVRFCGDQRNGLWAAYADGLTRVDEFGNVLSATSPLPGALRPVDCVFDSEGRLWAGSTNSISAWKDGAWRTFSAADGMPVRGARQLAFHENKIWFSPMEPIGDIATLSLDRGKPTWQRFGPATGHAAGFTRSLDTDSRGWLWRGGKDLGLQVCAARCEIAENWMAILDQDGLNHNTSGQGQWSEAAGKIWIVAENTMNHVTIDPAMFTRNTDPMLTAPRLTREGSTVRAEFGSTYFRHRSALEVRYRMSPGAREWKPARGWTTHYERLWPGTYTFEVQARTGRGAWHAAVTRSSITVPPPWREISLGAGALAAAGAALARRRRRKLDPYFAAKLLFERAKPLMAEERVALFATADKKVVEEVKLLLELHEADDELPPVFPDPLLGGRYRLEQEIASGGFATVYRARDLRLSGRLTAIKILNDAAPEKAIERESAALAMVRHEGVVAIYDRGQTREGQAYLALEFVEGETLRAKCGEPQPVERVREWATQAGEILAAVHACGVVHRDLKPENVMIEPSGRLRVIDFGIASMRAGGEHSTWATRLAGSLEYMAPEQLYGQALPATDVYALALIVVECLTGKRVTPAAAEWGETVDRAARRLLDEAGLGAIDLTRAFKFDPNEREADVRAIARLLT
jgi:predicted Ser/Thr protein kinase